MILDSTGMTRVEDSSRIFSGVKIKSFFDRYPLVLWKTGQVIIEGDHNPPGVFYLTRGLVRQFIFDKNGKEINLHVFVKGSFFPMLWGLAGKTNRFWYRADGNVRARVAPRKEVVNFLKQNPGASLDFAKRLLFGIDGLLKRIELLTTFDAKSRIHSVTQFLGRRYKGKKLTQTKLASWAGLSRETVTRITASASN